MSNSTLLVDNITDYLNYNDKWDMSIDHHKLWIICQKYTMIPIILILFYKIIFGPSNLNKYYTLNYLESHIEFFKVYKLFDYRFYLNLNNRSNRTNDRDIEKLKLNNKIELKPTLAEIFIKIYAFTSVLYYSADIMHKILFIGIFNLDFCMITYLYHHILTLFYVKLQLKNPYWTWYQLYVPAYHSVIIGFPNYFNIHKIFYGIGILSFCFQFLFKNARRTLSQKYLMSSCFLIPVANISLLIRNCK